MAMGTRRGRQRQQELWVATATLARPASHPFYERLNRLLDQCGFDEFAETLCQPFYAESLGRPSLVPGMYFRLLMVGYFEGMDSERGIAWRAADSLGIRAFLGVALDESAPDQYPARPFTLFTLGRSPSWLDLIKSTVFGLRMRTPSS